MTSQTRKILEHLQTTNRPTSTHIAKALKVKMSTVSSVLSKGVSAGVLRRVAPAPGERAFRYLFTKGTTVDVACRAITKHERKLKQQYTTKTKQRNTKPADVGVSLTLRFGGRNHPCTFKEAHDLWEQLNQFFDTMTAPGE